MLNMQNKEITQLMLGEIHQTCIVALDKLCSQQQLLEGIMKNQKRYSKTCKKKYMEIKCKKKDCSCKKSFSKGRSFMKHSKHKKRFKGKRKVNFLGPNLFKGRKRAQSVSSVESQAISQNPAQIKQKNLQDSFRLCKSQKKMWSNSTVNISLTAPRWRAT